MFIQTSDDEELWTKKDIEGRMAMQPERMVPIATGVHESQEVQAPGSKSILYSLFVEICERF